MKNLTDMAKYDGLMMDFQSPSGLLHSDYDDMTDFIVIDTLNSITNQSFRHTQAQNKGKGVYPPKSPSCPSPIAFVRHMSVI